MAEPPSDAPDPRLVRGAQLLLARAWFEAHEALEELWRELLDGPERDGLQAVIQHAVALEHLRRGNALGAFNVSQKARARVRSAPSAPCGIELRAWDDGLVAFYREAQLAERVRAQLQGGVAAGDAPPVALRALPPDAAWPVPALDDLLAAAVRGAGAGR